MRSGKWIFFQWLTLEPYEERRNPVSPLTVTNYPDTTHFILKASVSLPNHKYVTGIKPVQGDGYARTWNVIKRAAYAYISWPIAKICSILDQKDPVNFFIIHFFLPTSLTKIKRCERENYQAPSLALIPPKLYAPSDVYHNQTIFIIILSLREKEIPTHWVLKQKLGQ